METSVSEHIDDHAREKPTQGIFIGWLALALLVFALAWAATGILAGATHGWQ